MSGARSERAFDFPLAGEIFQVLLEGFFKTGAGEAMERKIVHVDMDCFYAAIEERENPGLSGKPVAVGGRSRHRGVLTTANYEARKYGCRSAMPVFKALQLCPHLILLPVRFELYQAESALIREILRRFTPLIEPLSLDEAYLDLSHLKSGAANVAAEIRSQIWEERRLCASAGVAPNKFLAKVASDWRKPNGQFEIRSGDVAEFMRDLPVLRIPGVGTRTASRLEGQGVRTCGDLQRWELRRLTREFGKFGVDLFRLCRGEDTRPVVPDRERKSLSNERTFADDLESEGDCRVRLQPLLGELRADLEQRGEGRRVAKCFLKLKFHDFRSTTAERTASTPDEGLFEELLAEAWARGNGRRVRLLGAGVRFAPEKAGGGQLQLFDGENLAEDGCPVRIPP